MLLNNGICIVLPLYCVYHIFPFKYNLIKYYPYNFLKFREYVSYDYSLGKCCILKSFIRCHYQIVLCVIQCLKSIEKMRKSKIESIVHYQITSFSTRHFKDHVSRKHGLHEVPRFIVESCYFGVV